MAVEWTAAITELPDGRAAWAAARRKGDPAALDEGVLDPADKSAWRGVFKGMSAVLAVPSHRMVMRVLEFPASDEAELAGMVELQVDKFSPFPLDQMVVSHEVLARREGGCAVLAAAARAGEISAAGQRFKEAGILIGRVDALLLGRWKTLVDAGQLAREGRETLVLVDGGGVDVLTHEAGVPVALSGLGEVPSVGEADTASDLSQEIEHLLMALEAERGRMSPSVISVWSQAGEGQALTAALQARLSRAVHERALDTLGSAVGGSARRALAAGSGLLDLTPPAWRETERLQRLRWRLIGSGAVLLGVWLLLAAGGWGALALRRAQTERLKAAEQQWIESANAVRRVRTQVQTIRRYMDRKTSSLECLREISMLQPPGVDLTSFTYRKADGIIELVGEADSGSLVILFNQRLNASELFESVKVGPRTQTPRQRHRFSFEILFKKEAP